MKLISVDLCSSMTETLLPELVNVALNLTGATKSFSRPSIVVVDIHVAVPDRRIEESTKLVVKVCGWNRARLAKDLVLTRQLNKACVFMIAKLPIFDVSPSLLRPLYLLQAFYSSRQTDITAMIFAGSNALFVYMISWVVW